MYAQAHGQLSSQRQLLPTIYYLHNSGTLHQLSLSSCCTVLAGASVIKCGRTVSAAGTATIWAAWSGWRLGADVRIMSIVEASLPTLARDSGNN